MSTRLLNCDVMAKHESEPDYQLRCAFEKHLQSLNGCHYAYFVTHKGLDVKPRIISNYPERWLRAYRAANYHLIDPVINHGLKCVAPFSWREALEAKESAQSDDVFALSQKYQISMGYTFNLHDSNGLFAALSICNTERRVDFEQVMQQRAAEIQMTLIQFHNSLTATFAPNELFSASADTSLSDREMGVLKWVVMGKAYREIAAMHAISVRTVKFHMSNVVHKLQVRNAKQAVYKAVSLGLV